jgi:serpin B
VVKRRLAAGLVAGALIGMAGCASGSGAGGGAAGGSGGGSQLLGVVEPTHDRALTAAQIAADDGVFGFDLFKRLCAAAPDANIVLSPASAAQAIGMIDAGSAGQTRAAVSRVLHLPTWGPAVVSALHAQHDALARVSQVTVTNHLWEQLGLHPTARTLNDLRTAYNSDLRQLDFTKEPQATSSINAVISHDTGGLIPNLFDSLDPSTQTVVADAILLDAKWRQPFADSSAGTFHSGSGHDVTAQLMDNSQGSFASRTSAGWQSVVLPYTGNLQAVAILPPRVGGGSAASGCSTPSAGTLAGLTKGPSRSVGVVLPKVDLSQTLPLTKVLARMGLPLAGDFTGLGGPDSQITEILQKAVMKVDENGTKAAAATGGVLASSARVATDVVTFDRPFLLLLEDAGTHTPLFLARVADPTQN